MMRKMQDAASNGCIALQTCLACGTLQYPPRELCRVCLSDNFAWRTEPSVEGKILATTQIHHSNEAAFRPRLPLRIGLVQLSPGATALCFVPHAEPGASVQIRASLDPEGRAILTAECAA
jgi:uncharacterized OB-fold protein